MSGKADKIIERLKLKAHPEGGYFGESYRSDEKIKSAALPKRYSGDRVFSTSIYFLLKRGEVSKLHRLKSDEIWYYHAGASLTVHEITPDGVAREYKLGMDIGAGEEPQAVIREGSWFGAVIGNKSGEDYALVGCAVAPGFEFDDFEMADGDGLVKKYPAHSELIRSLT